MGIITYTASLNTQKAWQNQGVVYVSGPSDTMPDGGIATKVSLSVYCGATTYNKSQECSFVLTDTWGNSIEIAEDVSWGSVNRVTVEVSGTPDQQLDWNNLSSIDVDGDDDYLNLRGTGTITIEYEEYSWNYGPSNIIISPNNDGTFDISWDAASWSGPGNIWYFIKTPSIPGDITWDTGQTFLSNLPIPEYEEVIFYLWAKEYDTGTTGETISKTYTFELPYKTIKYHNGETWVKCIPHYHNGTRWVRCDVYYHNGTEWKLSNH
jgi:hypothetical protein